MAIPAAPRKGTAAVGAAHPKIAAIIVVPSTSPAHDTAYSRNDTTAARYGEKSGGELSRPLYQIAGPDPEALEPAQRGDDAIEVGLGDGGLLQQLDVPPVHPAQPIPQRATLIGQLDVDRAAIVHRALLRQIVVLDHLLDVIGDVGAEIAAAQGQLADGHLGVADVEQHHALHVVEVVNAVPVEFQFDNFEKPAVKLFDKGDDLQISLGHNDLLASPDQLPNQLNLATNPVDLSPTLETWLLPAS